jgi:hypothetical protein
VTTRVTCDRCKRPFDLDGTIWIPSYCPECEAKQNARYESRTPPSTGGSWGRDAPSYDDVPSGTDGSGDRREPDPATPMTQDDVDRVIDMVRRVEVAYERRGLSSGDTRSHIEGLLADLYKVRKMHNLHLAPAAILDVLKWGLEELEACIAQYAATPITQDHVDQVVGIVHPVEEAYERCSMMNKEFRARFDGFLVDLRATCQPQNLHLAHVPMLDVMKWGLGELAEYVSVVQYARETVNAQQAKIRQLETEIERLQVGSQAEIERLQQMVWQPSSPATATLPERTIQVRSPIQQVILRLMATEGLARSWRLQQRVMEAGLTQNENSVRNALRKLERKDLVADYHWNGHKAGWSPVPGGRRRLVALTERGQDWCRRVFDEEPVAPEVTAMAQKHNSVTHAVGILEARDHLQARGYPVDDDPDAILVEEGERWGRRAEPDLTTVIDGQAWPVEVQREVAQRHTMRKWSKVLELAGRLALVLFSEEKRGQQAKILEQATDELPAGEIRLASLEAMETGSWKWAFIDSPFHR